MYGPPQNIKTNLKYINNTDFKSYVKIIWITKSLWIITNPRIDYPTKPYICEVYFPVLLIIFSNEKIYNLCLKTFIMRIGMNWDQAQEVQLVGDLFCL